MNKVLFSKNSDNWATPSILYNYFMNRGFFDPCPLGSNFNGLDIPWKQFNFVNPPYSQISKWIDKAIIEHQKGNFVILLIPSRTDTNYFYKLVKYGIHIYFIKGRLKFNNMGSAPFPSCLIFLNGSCSTTCSWITNKCLDNFP